ncbi:uncharacterized protein METZ01_LOCUS513987, partial [marine metagenome]
YYRLKTWASAYAKSRRKKDNRF